MAMEMQRREHRDDDDYIVTQDTPDVSGFIKTRTAVEDTGKHQYCIYMISITIYI